MKPKASKRSHAQPLIGARLELLVDLDHELARLASAIDWTSLETAFGRLYVPDVGRPGIRVRLMAGLVLLQHTFAMSDEEVVKRWPENPYWQMFCGEEFFQHRLPIHPSQLSRWRKRIGEAGCEKLLSLTIGAGKRTKTITESSCEKVIVDTTVQPKAIQHPTDTRLHYRALMSLVRVAKLAFLKHGRYMKAKQFRRARKEQKRIKTFAGRVYREPGRKLTDESYERRQRAMILSELVLTQKRTTKGKVYDRRKSLWDSLHAPEVECLGEGKAHKPYEFGVKVSLAVTHKEGFVVGIQACPDNPYDGHTLDRQLEQVRALTGHAPKRVFVDKGYKGHKVDRCEVFLSGTRKLPPTLKRELRRRSAIEPAIGHMKADGNLGRNHLKGMTGDAMNALLCGAGHDRRKSLWDNTRKILARLRLLFAFLWTWLLALLSPQNPQPEAA